MEYRATDILIAACCISQAKREGREVGGGGGNALGHTVRAAVSQDGVVVI